MKNAFKFPFAIILMAIINTSCNKEMEPKNQQLVVKQPQSIFKELPIIEKSISINKDDELIKKFVLIEQEKSKIINSSNAKFYSIQFKNYPTLLGLQIKLAVTNGVEKDIFFVVESKTMKNLSIVRIIDNNQNSELKDTCYSS